MRIAEIQRRNGKFDDALATLKKAEAKPRTRWKCRTT